MKPPFILKSSLRLDRLFDEYTGQPALIAPSGVRTFDDVRQCLQRVIVNLKAAGVEKGRLVAFHGENTELHLYLFLAAWMMDFLYIPLDFKAPLQSLIREKHFDFLITAEDIPATANLSKSLIPGTSGKTALFLQMFVARGPFPSAGKRA